MKETKASITDLTKDLTKLFSEQGCLGVDNTDHRAKTKEMMARNRCLTALSRMTAYIRDYPEQERVRPPKGNSDYLCELAAAYIYLLQGGWCEASEILRICLKRQGLAWRSVINSMIVLLKWAKKSAPDWQPDAVHDPAPIEHILSITSFSEEYFQELSQFVKEMDGDFEQFLSFLSNALLEDLRLETVMYVDTVNPRSRRTIRTSELIKQLMAIAKIKTCLLNEPLVPAGEVVMV